MFNNLVASFVLVVFVFSNLFIFLGRRIIMNLPTVRRFLKDKDKLANAVLGKAIPRGTEIAVMCLRLLRDYVDCSLKDELQRYARRTIGDVIVIVHYHEIVLRKIITELRIYSGFLAVLGVAGGLSLLPEADFKIDLHLLLNLLWKAAGERPFHLIGLLEFIMLVFFLMRLCVELASIKEHLEP